MGKWMRGGLCALLVMGLAACGAADGGGSGDGAGSGGSTAKGELSGMGTTPTFADHDSYLVGTHKNFTCGDTCHAIPLTARTAEGETASTAATADRTQICAQCHLGNYNATSALNHQQYGIGTYCNSCHYSDNFRSHNRVSHDQWHNKVSGDCASCHASRAPSWHQQAGLGGGCEDCHAYPAFKPAAHNNHSRITGNNCESCHAGRQPGTHGSDRKSACGRCHTYPTWQGAKFSHAGINNGCNRCHSRHYGNFDCIGCHTKARPGSSFGPWAHRNGSSKTCVACHKNGKGGDEGGKLDNNGGAFLTWLE